VRWLWAPAHWWPLWLGATIGTFALRELWALITRHPEGTLSDWVWGQLHIVTRESITQWSAADLLLFVVYLGVFVAWLPWHFWFRKFT
jgi:hypothetical protein